MPESSKMEKNGLFNPAFIKIIAALIIFFSVCVLLFKTENKGIDFWSYYYAGKVAFTNGEKMYDVQYLQELSDRENGYKVFPYLYPPVFAQLLKPLTSIPSGTLLKIWYFFQWVLVAFSLYFSLLMAGAYKKNKRLKTIEFSGRKYYWFLLVLVFLFLVLPFRNNIELGQVNIFVVTLIMASLFFYYKEKYFWCGLLLAFSIMIKVTPAILLLFFLLDRKFKPLIFTVFFLLFIFLISYFADSNSWNSFFAFLPETVYGGHIAGLFEPGNTVSFSLASFFIRLLGEGNITLVKALSISTIIVLLTALFISAYRRRENNGLLLLPLHIIMIISAPYAYFHHIVYLFPGIVIYFAALEKSIVKTRNKKFTFTVLLLMLMALLAANIDFPKYYMVFEKNNILAFTAELLFYSVNLFCLIFLFILSLYFKHQNFFKPEKIEISE